MIRNYGSKLFKINRGAKPNSTAALLDYTRTNVFLTSSEWPGHPELVISTGGMWRAMWEY